MKDNLRLKVITDFLKFAYHELDIKNAPKIQLTSDKKYATSNRSFGGYLPANKTIIVYIGNRNLADILRTLCHELVHHSQLEKGQITAKSGETGSEQENEANQLAGVILRKYGSMNPLIYESVHYSMLKEDLASHYLYCDMDGVLCDFDAQCEHYFGMNAKDLIDSKGNKRFVELVDDIGIDFWKNMPWTKSGKKLWNKIGKHGITILTSPSVFKYAKQGKQLWIKNNLDPQPKRIIFKQTGSKHTALDDVAKEDRGMHVLIDDWSDNLKPWRAVGGLSIQHTDERPSINLLKQLDNK